MFVSESLITQIIEEETKSALSKSFLLKEGPWSRLLGRTDDAVETANRVDDELADAVSRARSPDAEQALDNVRKQVNMAKGRLIKALKDGVGQKVGEVRVPKQVTVRDTPTGRNKYSGYEIELDLTPEGLQKFLKRRDIALTTPQRNSVLKYLKLEQRLEDLGEAADLVGHMGPEAARVAWGISSYLKVAVGVMALGGTAILAYQYKDGKLQFFRMNPEVVEALPELEGINEEAQEAMLRATEEVVADLEGDSESGGAGDQDGSRRLTSDEASRIEF